MNEPFYEIRPPVMNRTTGRWSIPYIVMYFPPTGFAFPMPLKVNDLGKKPEYEEAWVPDKGMILKSIEEFLVKYNMIQGEKKNEQ
jgi:hypothetical protein